MSTYYADPPVSIACANPSDKPLEVGPKGFTPSSADEANACEAVAGTGAISTTRPTTKKADS